MGVWAAADLQKVLGRYGDFVTVLGLLPIFSHLKFGGLLRARQGQDEAQQDGKREIPSAAALWLLLFGDFLANFALFQPSEKTVVRAVREIGLAQQKSSGGAGFTQLLDTAARLLTKDDVYVLVRLVAYTGAVGGLAITVTLKLHEIQGTSSRSGHPLKELWRALKQLLSMAGCLQPWFFATLTAAVVLGNWTVFAKLAATSSVKSAMVVCGTLLRTLGVAMALWGQTGGPMPTWAATQAAAAFVRGAQRFMYERISIETLTSQGVFHPGGAAASATVASLQGALLLEAVICLCCCFAVLKQPRISLLTGMLCMPAAMALDNGKPLRFLEAHATAADALHKLAIAVSVTALLTVFMGGVLTMVSFVLLLRVLGYIHKLDKIKL